MPRVDSANPSAAKLAPTTAPAAAKPAPAATAPATAAATSAPAASDVFEREDLGGAAPAGNLPPRLQVTVGNTSSATAQACASKEELAAAGTTAAKDLKLPEGRVVEGPSAFDDRSHSDLPGPVSQALEKAAVWFTFGLANKSEDRLRLGGDATHLPLPRIAGSDMVKLTEPGPNGEPPALQPGDFIINGVDGHAGHLTVYLGKDPATGVPMVVHAMADAAGQQSYLQQLGNAAAAPFVDTGKVGVIKEPLAGFFDRYQRDTAFIVRDPRLTPQMRQAGLDRVQQLVGKPYDYSLNMKNDAYYCSEMGVEFEKAAYQGSGQSLPWVGTSWIEQGVWPAKIAQWVATPQNFAVSPDFQLTWANDAGKADYLHDQQSYVVGAKS